MHQTLQTCAKSPGMCWEASVWLGGWWRWSLGRPWRPTNRSSLETDAFPGLPAATSANGGHVAAAPAARLFTSKADPLQARGQPGLTARLCCHLRTLSHFLDLLEQPNTTLTQPRSRAWTQQQQMNHNFEPMLQPAQRGFTLPSTAWIPCCHPGKTSASPFPRCY